MIDPNWCRENPEEAARQLELLGSENSQLKGWQQEMVAKAAGQSLEGYRELGERAAKAEGQRDEYRNHLAMIAELTGNAGDIGAAYEGVVALELHARKLSEALAYATDPENQPEYHEAGMGCGLEDRGITCRYEAMRHGWDAAMERVYSEVMPPQELLALPLADAVTAEQERVAKLERDLLGAQQHIERMNRERDRIVMQARHDWAAQGVEAVKLHHAREVIEGFRKACETNGDQGECFGLAVSGPVFCSDVAACLKACRAVFTEAMRIIDWKIDEQNREHLEAILAGVRVSDRIRARAAAGALTQYAESLERVGKRDMKVTIGEIADNVRAEAAVVIEEACPGELDKVADSTSWRSTQKARVHRAALAFPADGGES